MEFKLNWNPSRGDHRDFIFRASENVVLPSSVNNSDFVSNIRVLNQGNLGSCTANAASGAYTYERLRKNEEHYHPSRLFIYYNERAIEGTVDYDSGAYVRDIIKVLNKLGAPKEWQWNYTKDFRQRPSDQAFKEALSWRISEYQSVDNSNIQNVKAAIAQGHAVIFGFTCYESLESDKVAETGIIPMPLKNESVIGGHCTYLHGYDDSKQLFDGRNSWGRSWGQKGNFQIPYEYIATPKLASDFWIITQLV